MSDDGASAINLPKSGGSIRGIGEKFQPQAFDGTGSFSIPISTSPGRTGFGPQLSLRYGTGQGNGQFGLGWSLDIPCVSRKTDKGLPRYAGEDVFVVSGAEDLVPLAPGSPLASGPAVRGVYTVQSYRPRTEGLFACIERWTRSFSAGAVTKKEEHWRVVTRDNVTSLYGLTRDAQISDPGDGQRVFQWLLQETFDSKGNHVLYEYAQDDPLQPPDDICDVNRVAAQRYIRRIFYGNLPTGLSNTHADGSAIGVSRRGSDPADPSRLVARHYALEVVFDHGDWGLPADLTAEEIPWNGYRSPSASAEIFGDGSGTTINTPVRDDAFSVHRAGFEVRTRRLCRRVLMYHHFQDMTPPLPVRATCFRYGAAPHSQIALLQSVCMVGFRPADTASASRLVQRSLPPLDLSYSEFRPHEQRFLQLSARDNQMPPVGLQNAEFALADLFGDGMPDVIHGGASGFRYWRNLGSGKLDLPRLMTEVPSGLTLGSPGVTLGDTNGDGCVELVVQSGAVQGYFETSPQSGWRAFHAFPPQPTIDHSNPELRRVDLTGDGLLDMLVTLDHHFLWYQNLEGGGFKEQPAVERIHNENDFPDVFFGDPSGRIRLADMTGDGLVDIVRIHHGTVEYWPNLGYGRFGKRIIMGAVPDAPQSEGTFDGSRLFFVDLDGTGCADLVYVGFNEVHFWFNRSGNGWSARQVISGTPFAPTGSGLDFADILGTGTATLVWSRDLGAIPGGNYFALDFCGGVKPHLLVGIDNGLGAATRIEYAPSTRFALEDAAAGKPWHTTLPFPVHVVAKVETIDRVSRSRHVSSYRYRHGFFDGREREFRGFGCVEQLDTEEFAEFALGLVDGRAALNADRALHLPPVRTRTWFHTGAWIEPESLAAQFRAEFWRGDASALGLLDHDVPNDAEAFRALRGSVLRSEIYALDADPLNPAASKVENPFSVTETRYRVRQLQARGTRLHGAFHASAAEILTHHYERNPADPRITHEIISPPDDFGNITDKLSIAYPRRVPDADVPEQAETKIVYTKADFVNRADAQTGWLIGVAAQTRAFEVTAVLPSGPQGKYDLGDFRALTADLVTPFSRGSWTAYHDAPPSGGAAKRLIEWTRTYFRKDTAAADPDRGRTLANRLPLGIVEPLALPYEVLTAAFTKGLLAQVYGSRVDDPTLTRAGYVVEADVADHWWLPSARTVFDPIRFLLPLETIDAFGNATRTSYDTYALMAERVVDAVGNETKARIDYRLLQPFEVTSPNGHISEAAFDAVGRVAGTAVRSRTGEGDTLAGFVRDPTLAQIQAFVADPRGQALGLLQGATTRVIYDLSAAPALHSTIARTEHHSANPAPRTMLTFVYFDGFGRPVQTKAKAAPYASGAPRWVGTGWTVYDNKGKPVRQFEPFFGATHRFESDLRQGVSPFLFYDSLGRLIATLRPDHSWEKVMLASWQQVSHDTHDTILVADPRMDPDVGHIFRLLPQAEWWPTWYAARIGSSVLAERQAAQKAAAHANTPALFHLDGLARKVLSIGDLGGGRQLKTRTSYDVKGSAAAITDPRGVVAFTYRFDMAQRQLEIGSADAGRSLLLPDVRNSPVLSWDPTGHRVLTLFDALGRQTGRWLLKPGETRHRLTQMMIYGESTGGAAAANSLRRQLWKTFDGAGLTENRAFDFKGNLVNSVRMLWSDPVTQPEWGDATDPFTHAFDEAGARAALDTADVYGTSTTYDALDRVATTTTPDGSIQSFSFNDAGLLDGVTLRHRGAATIKTIVAGINYNARGQRTDMAYANGTEIKYAYDPLTFRLSRQTATRRHGPRQLLQDLQYAYDAVGNLTTVRDNAHRTVYFAGQAVDPESRYRYDALYRLIEATGREHVAFGCCHHLRGDEQQTEYIPLGANNQPVSNAQALVGFTERYAYDDSGNITEMRHLRRGNTHWVRTQIYDSASNHLKRSEAGCVGEGFDLQYNSNGNLRNLSHVPILNWDDRNQLVSAKLSVAAVNPNHAYYQYDALSTRVRKTVIRGAQLEQRLYFNGFDLSLSWTGSTAHDRWESLHISDGSKVVCTIETQTAPTDAKTEMKVLTRFQLSDHLRSTALELDDSTSTRLISYEEFSPFGATTYIAGANLIEVRRKKYRLSGKERDNETGLSYFGARYYSATLARWLSCDPIRAKGVLNLYSYNCNNPINLIDPDGLQSQPTPEEDAFEMSFVDGMSLLNTPANEPEDGRVPQEVAGALPEFGSHLGQELERKVDQITDRTYYKSIKGSEPHQNSVKSNGSLHPIGIKEPLPASAAGLEEEHMTVRHLKGAKAINTEGTDRTSFTQDVYGAIRRADGDRSLVCKVKPDEIESAGGRFKRSVAVLDDVRKVQAAGNSEWRRKAQYAEGKAIQFSEGQAVGSTPPQTVRPLGRLDGRWNWVGRQAGKGGALLLGALNDTPAQLTEAGTISYGVADTVHAYDAFFSGEGLTPVPGATQQSDPAFVIGASTAIGGILGGGPGALLGFAFGLSL